ncbi:hypothetical protein ACLKA6_003258 [Drosophila palustris]
MLSPIRSNSIQAALSLDSIVFTTSMPHPAGGCAANWHKRVRLAFNLPLAYTISLSCSMVNFLNLTNEHSAPESNEIGNFSACFIIKDLGSSTTHSSTHFSDLDPVPPRHIFGAVRGDVARLTTTRGCRPSGGESSPDPDPQTWLWCSWSGSSAQGAGIAGGTDPAPARSVEMSPESRTDVFPLDSLSQRPLKLILATARKILRSCVRRSLFPVLAPPKDTLTDSSATAELC